MSELLIVGCGYLGRRVARQRLLEDVASVVTGTTRSDEGATSLRELGIRPAVADVLDPEGLATVPVAAQILYCVGYDRRSGIPMRKVYVEGLGLFLDHLEASGWSGRLVYTSSTGVYGQEAGEWVDEESEAAPKHESGIVCLEAENLLRGRSAARGWSAATVRLAGLYGPGRIVQKEAVERGGPIVGDPDRWLNLIHVDDAAAVALKLLEAARPRETYVAADDRPIRRREYYESLAKILGVSPPEFTAVAPGDARSGREASNKRVRNARIKGDLEIALEFPDIATGLPHALG